MFLKTYYPKEFMASLLSNTANKVDQNTDENKFVDYFYEAKRMKINVLPPDVNNSEKAFKVIGDGIQSGFGFIKGLGDKAVQEILLKRPFRDLKDFMMKCDGRSVNKSAVLALIHSGCFDKFLDLDGGRKNLVKRYDLVKEYYAFKKDKKSEFPTDPTALMAIFEESEVVGAELFNNVLHLVDKDAANEGLDADDRIMSFSGLEKINSGTTIRVCGVVDSFFCPPNKSGKLFGILKLKNANKTHKVMVWQQEVLKLQNDPEYMGILATNNVISVRVERTKDFKFSKSFVLKLDNIKKLL
jgi:DNA polymerase-3 subunit alpha